MSFHLCSPHCNLCPSCNPRHFHTSVQVSQTRTFPFLQMIQSKSNEPTNIILTVPTKFALLHQGSKPVRTSLISLCQSANSPPKPPFRSAVVWSAQTLWTILLRFLLTISPKCCAHTNVSSNFRLKLGVTALKPPVIGSRTHANMPSIFPLQSKSRCGTGLSWPQGETQLVPIAAIVRLSLIHLGATHNLS